MDRFALIIFGITSNLSQIKLIPALYDMAEEGLLPEDMTIVGVARGKRSDSELKDYFHQVLHSENRHHEHDIKDDIFEKLSKQLHYMSGELNDPKFYTQLNEYLKKQGCQNKIFYLATYPELYPAIFDNLQKLGMNKQEDCFVRLMIEKPIGNDLTSAQQLNRLLTKYFSEDQIFRIDHYLGKETLQNILTFRFGNGIFEPLINKNFVDHIQVTALEDFGIGARGGYYDKVGALKDVGQNHLLQMLSFATMEGPSEFTNEAVTRERLKILQSLMADPKNLVLGQYEGYSQEKNVAPNSLTNTYFAFKTQLNNERFKGVPVYVRGGKKLAEAVTEISIVFKNPINRLFKNLDCGEEPNVLIYRIQPNEGVVLKILAKKPGHALALEPEYMQYCYRPKTPPAGSHFLPDPYERLILDALAGNQTFFNDAEEIEAQWSFIDKLFSANPKPSVYKPGSWGPKEADQLIEKDGRAWLEPSMQFCSI